MAWYRGTGKENHKSLFDKPLKDKCLFCGSIEEIECQMTIQIFFLYLLDYNGFKGM